MGETIFFIVLAVLCLLLLLPVRLRFAVHGKKEWQIQIDYVCFPLLTKSADSHAVIAPDDATPPTANDIVEEEDLLFWGGGDIPPINDDTLPTEETVISNGVHNAKDDADLFSTAQSPPAQEHTSDDEKTASKKKPKKPSLFERAKPHGIAQWKALVDDALASLAPPLRFLLRHIYLRKLYVGITVGTKDAAKTAILYGAVCSTIYRTLGKLQCHITVKPKAIRIRSDFLNPFCTAQCSGELWISPMTILGLCFGIVIPFLWRTLRRMRRQEKQKQQEDAESAPQPAA